MNFSNDLRVALRRLANAPGFTAATVIMLALGIGLSVMMYCTVNGVLLRGLPFPGGNRVVMMLADNPAQNIPRAQLTTAEAEQLTTGTAGFETVGFFQWSGVTVLDGGRPREISTQVVGAGFFETLGLKPVLGRMLSAEDIHEERPFAVLSYGEWQRSFGGDPQVLGRRLDLAGDAPLEVVGVMPPEMGIFSGDTGLWSPLLERSLPKDGARRLDQRFLGMLGRLREGVSLQQADAALNAQAAALREAHGLGAAAAEWRMSARPLIDLLVGDARSSLWSALALAVMVLLIACANVAILIDARQVARRRELAVMQAIGASAQRLRRGLVLELLLLAGVAVALGIVLAQGGIGLLRELARGSVPRIDGIVMDWRVLGFAVLLGLAAPFVAALSGSLRVRGEPAEAIRSGGKGVVGSGGQRRLLPVLAMALSTVSLVAAFGLGIGLWRLQHVDPGFDAENVHALQMFRESMNADSGAAGPPEWIQFAETVQERLGALPGARAVALTSAAPLSQIGSASVEVKAPGSDMTVPVQAAVRRVSPGYRSVLEIPLLAGRDFSVDDRAGTEPVAIVNRTLARRLFGEASPLDRSISLPMGRNGQTTCRVVGVVDDIHNDGLRAAPAPEVLVSFAQQPRVAMTFLLRSDTALAGIDAQMAEALWSVDPRQSITRQFALSDELASQLRPARFFARIVGFFALAALALAVFGVYAVTSLQQQRRIGEFGLRLAIGATPGKLAGTVLRDSFRISGLGIAAGFVGVCCLLRLFDTSSLGIDGDAAPLVLVSGLLAMSLAALVAAVLPALRAARIPPMEALRNE
jgi:predicted permease